MAEQPPPRPLKDYLKPTTDGYGSSIAPPPITKASWEIKPALLNLISQNTFGGMPNEEPAEHIQTFQEICDTFKDGNIPTDAVYLRMFPFSLRDKAKDWVRRQPNGKFNTWKQLADGFLQQYYPPGLTNEYIRKISNFKQFNGETLYEAWERYKDLQRQCPHHGFPKHILINFFYAGVDFQTKQTMNHASGGSLMDQPPEEAESIIEGLATNCHLWGGERGSHSQAAPTYASHSAVSPDAVTLMANQIAALTKTLNGLNVNQVNHVSTLTPCGMCNVQDHDVSDCPFLQNSAIPEAAVNYIGGRNQVGYGQKNNYNPTYSPNNRNHPNFSYLNNNPFPQGYELKPQYQTYNPGYNGRQGDKHQQHQQTQQQRQESQVSNSDILKAIESMKKETNERLDKCEYHYDTLNNRMQQMETQVRMVETQVAQ